MGCLNYDPKRPALADISSSPQPALAIAAPVAQTQTAARLTAVHVAPHVMSAEAGQTRGISVEATGFEAELWTGPVHDGVVSGKIERDLGPARSSI